MNTYSERRTDKHSTTCLQAKYLEKTSRPFLTSLLFLFLNRRRFLTAPKRANNVIFTWNFFFKENSLFLVPTQWGQQWTKIRFFKSQIKILLCFSYVFRSAHNRKKCRTSTMHRTREKSNNLLYKDLFSLKLKFQ